MHLRNFKVLMAPEPGSEPGGGGGGAEVTQTPETKKEVVDDSATEFLNQKVETPTEQKQKLFQSPSTKGLAENLQILKNFQSTHSL